VPNRPIESLCNGFDASDLTVPSFGITFGDPTPADLYPTDVYTLEYDGFADFPQYPIDRTQIQDAIPLETLPSAGNGLSDHFLIPVTDLPLLDPLRLIPVVGNPLADLPQPDMTVLVNLGYGSITDGWSQRPANVATPFDLFPTDLNWSDVLTALVNGVPQGIEAAIADLDNPDNYQITSLLDNPT
jgi:PE-PPE domain